MKHGDAETRRKCFDRHLIVSRSWVLWQVLTAHPQGTGGTRLLPGGHRFQIRVGHHLRQFLDRYPRLPPKLFAGERGVAEQQVDFRGAIVVWVDFDDRLAAGSMPCSCSPWPRQVIGRPASANETSQNSRT